MVSCGCMPGLFSDVGSMCMLPQDPIFSTVHGCNFMGPSCCVILPRRQPPHLQVAGRPLMPATGFLEAAAACSSALREAAPSGTAPALTAVSIAAALLVPQTRVRGHGSAALVEARCGSRSGTFEVRSAPLGRTHMQQHFAARYSTLVKARGERLLAICQVNEDDCWQHGWCML